MFWGEIVKGDPFNLLSEVRAPSPRASSPTLNPGWTWHTRNGHLIYIYICIDTKVERTFGWTITTMINHLIGFSRTAWWPKRNKRYEPKRFIHELLTRAPFSWKTQSVVTDNERSTNKQTIIFLHINIHCCNHRVSFEFFST